MWTGATTGRGVDGDDEPHGDDALRRWERVSRWTGTTRVDGDDEPGVDGDDEPKGGNGRWAGG